MIVLFQLHSRKAENELCCSNLRARIQGLWERLQVPQEEREVLSEHMVLSKKRNIAAVSVCRPVVTVTPQKQLFCQKSPTMSVMSVQLQDEVQRLEVLKMQSMRSVIEAIRGEIRQFWAKCFYSQEQQEAFIAFHSGKYGPIVPAGRWWWHHTVHAGVFSSQTTSRRSCSTSTRPR